ncbi:DUF4364 family protein [Sporosalibacterium faouarense]|uniref:DUF4364 family protein n=1 Tax=Sporosalibacterium faouarense TaxID=516123 RepID=UPI00141C8EF9|nr:DUF4364 family protein [Sporosalibacterium faouarense]MTI49552.1 DUF4364 family protein [Bacillota bacterium]
MFLEDTNELAQHKLLLLYLLNKIDIPMNNAEITQFVLEHNYMNYFLTQQYLSELVDANFIHVITVKNKKCYKLTDIGKETLEYFNNRIPKKLKKEIDEKYEKKKQTLIKEAQIIGNYYKKNDSQYIVSLKVIENEITLFDLSLNVVSNKQAKLICENWKKSPDKIYKKFMDYLTDEYKHE